MNTHTCEILQFERILQELADRTMSEDGRRTLADFGFLTEPEPYNRHMTRVRFCRTLLEGERDLPDTDFPSLASSVETLAVDGTVLEGMELSGVARYIRSAGALRRCITGGVDAANPLKEETDGLPDLDSVRRTIEGKVEPTGELRAEKIPELATLARKIQRIHGDILSTAERYIRENRSILRTDVPTQKDGRTVLPLNADYRGRIDGIVHDVSGSGQTLFIEPAEILQKNNELSFLQGEYRRVETKILRELTGVVREHLQEIRSMVHIVGYLDSLFARARFAARYACVPVECPSDRIELKEARHPLLGETCVPVNIGVSKQVLIISGPNTGGKTVTLKTVGLLGLMNQFGMELPVAEGSALPLFDDIRVEIGDEQSIDTSLSTYSARMRSIVDILNSSSDNSLVLVDELGSGTDPEEGAAVAMAILDHIIETGRRIIATTHHGVLKQYAFGHPSAENSAVEFDEQTHAPTYRLIPGVPGESHAIEIAERYGMPAPILRAARKYVRQGLTEVGAVIRELGRKSRELDAKLKSVGEREERIGRLEAELEERERDVTERELALRREGYALSKEFVSQGRKQLENLIRKVQEEAGDETRLQKSTIREAKSYLETITGTLESEQDAIEELEKELSEPIETPIEPGMEVAVGENRRTGTVIRRGKGDAWLVRVGSMKLEFPERQIYPVEEGSGGGRGNGKSAEHTGTAGKVRVSIEDAGAGSRPKTELDVRGLRLHEALDRVGRQMDAALMHGLSRFFVIHGMGDGILQQGIHEYLGENPHVSGYAFSRPEQGGTGRTVVDLNSGVGG